MWEAMKRKNIGAALALPDSVRGTWVFRLYFTLSLVVRATYNRATVYPDDRVGVVIESRKFN